LKLTIDPSSQAIHKVSTGIRLEASEQEEIAAIFLRQPRPSDLASESLANTAEIVMIQFSWK
jgi:hypothetical protein